jgi:hypothetical protein
MHRFYFERSHFSVGLPSGQLNKIPKMVLDKVTGDLLLFSCREVRLILGKSPAQIIVITL